MNRRLSSKQINLFVLDGFLFACAASIRLRRGLLGRPELSTGTAATPYSDRRSRVFKKGRATEGLHHETRRSLRKRLIRILAIYVALTALSSARADEPLARWSFDGNQPKKAHDTISGADDAILGSHLIVSGITQSALRMDGESTVIRRIAANVPRPERGLTVEAYIAVNAYPWNWVPIVDQARKQDAGYSFGLDAEGRLGLQVSTQGKWQSLLSTNPVPLRQWSHVAGTFDPALGLTLYVNGKVVGELPVQGALTLASEDDLLIGRVRQPVVPTHAIHPKYPVWYSFDGLLEDIRVYGAPLPAVEIQRQSASVALPVGSALPPPVLPAGDPGPGSFGAFYTTLHYDELWDASRRVGPGTDIVVRFDQSPVRLVFWQGPPTAETG